MDERVSKNNASKWLLFELLGFHYAQKGLVIGHCRAFIFKSTFIWTLISHVDFVKSFCRFSSAGAEYDDSVYANDDENQIKYFYLLFHLLITFHISHEAINYGCW